MVAGRNRHPEIVPISDWIHHGAVDPDLQPLRAAEVWRSPNDQVTGTVVARGGEGGGEAENEAEGKAKKVPRPDHPEI